MQYLLDERPAKSPSLRYPQDASPVKECFAYSAPEY